MPKPENYKHDKIWTEIKNRRTDEKIIEGAFTQSVRNMRFRYVVRVCVCVFSFSFVLGVFVLIGLCALC